MSWLQYLATSLALMSAPAFAKQAADPEAPSPERIAQYGCQALHVTDDAGVLWWHVTVWAEYKDLPKWSRKYAIRNGAEPVSKPLKDCDRWMKRTKKQAEKSRG